MMSAADAYNPQLPGAALSPVARLLRLVRAFAEASVVVIAFAVATLAVGTPIALAVRALHDIVSWLVLGP
jgi:hypothetical protein